MYFRRKKGFIQREIKDILFSSDTNNSDINIEENFSNNNISVLCLPSNSELISLENKELGNENQNHNDHLTLSSSRIFKNPPFVSKYATNSTYHQISSPIFHNDFFKMISLY